MRGIAVHARALFRRAGTAAERDEELTRRRLSYQATRADRCHPEKELGDAL